MLLAGKLSRENARVHYEDQRFFGLKVPEHLRGVLTAKGVTRNIMLFQKLTEELDLADRNLAFRIATGF